MVRKLRVYELGRHYGVDSKQIMTLLQKMKVQAKSHMSVVEDDEVDRVHSVFQRKRQLARENYAKAHNLNPDQLKNVAALKPLEKPVAPDEPETKKKPAKKKAKKKKAPAKPKVVTIKKAGQMTKVAKKAQAARDAEAKVKADEAVLKAEEKDRREAEMASRREEHAQARIVKSTAAKLVKKADVDKAREAEEAKAAEAAAAVDTETQAEDSAQEDPTSGLDAPAPTAETEVADTDAGSVTEDAPETEGAGETAEVPKEVVEAEADADAEADAEADDPLDKLGTKKNDGFKLGDIIKPAPKVKRPKAAPAVRKPEPKISSASVRDSIKAAIQRRQDEAAAREETTSRRKRTRKKKKKVDQAEVDRALKQTMAAMDGAGTKKKRKKGDKIDEDEVVVETAVLRLTEFITVQEMADKLGVKSQELIATLFSMGIMATINQRLEKENIELLAAEFEREVEFLTEVGEDVLEIEEAKDEDKSDRPPVVTVMGHVDHGKTSLLDSIRKTNVIAGEAGGITQHIGAYTVETDGGPITFLDTPGHAAFTAMRARGAQVTDVVILIVAANDGVMPQTVEAIHHAKAAKVPLIVAVNKIDLEDAKPDRVKQELLKHEIVVEEYGGDVLCAEISAKQGIGIEKLLEQVHLQTEVLELKATADGPARGTVVEAKKEPGRGVVFTVLVEQGTIKKGDNFLVGMIAGKVRALLDERGNKLDEVKPGEPCEIMGAHNVPEAGDRFYVVESERQARELADKRQRLQRQQKIVSPKVVIDLDNLAELMTTGELKELPIIIKGDVAGSVEALADQLMELNTEEVQVKVVHKAVGAVSESDVLLAANTGAIIIGFHMRPGPAIIERAKANNVTIEVFDIIYEAVDTLKKAMAGLLGSIKREVSTGKASVRQVFTIPKVGSVAGSMVIDGVIKRNSRARLIRDEVMIWEGKVNSLKRFKDDVKEVKDGYECGIGLENFYQIQENDVLECYEIEEIERTEL